jgi:hypothetical protein
VYAAWIRAKSAQCQSYCNLYSCHASKPATITRNRVQLGQQADIQVHYQRHRAVSTQQDFGNAHVVVFCQENPSGIFDKSSVIFPEGVYQRCAYVGIRTDTSNMAMHRSAYMSHGMGLSLLATATRPRNADKVKGTTSTKGSSFLVEKPAMRRRVIPGTRTPMVIRRS